MFRNRCFDMGGRDQFMYNNTQFAATDNNIESNMMGDNANCEMPGVVCPPVYECPQERCCHRQIHHKIDQDCQFM